MPVVEHRTTLPLPRSEVFAWHERPGAFTRLTPPGSATPISGPSDGIRDGSRMTVRISAPTLEALWPAALARVVSRPGLTWEVVHRDFEPGARFVDEQVRGPMASWRHEHEFIDAEGGGTTVIDRVKWRLPAGLGAVADRAVRRYLAGLFRFREEQLRADLALHARWSGTPRVVVVSGASGMIGTQLCALLTSGGHEVRRLVRRPTRTPDEFSWNPATGEVDPAALPGADAVVNLSGRSIAGRLTTRARTEIRESRLDATTTLVRAIAAAGDEGPGVLVNASAIGFYGPQRPGEVLDEASAQGPGFLADVVAQWESAAQPVTEHGVRLVLLRTGIVLGAAAGALALQVPLFWVGAGGRLTRADASLSWIGLDDMARVYATAVLDPTWSGLVNAVAPEPATAAEFAHGVGRVMHRPSLVPTPAFGPRLLLGADGAAELVETDQFVSADRLASLGYTFAQPGLDTALRHALAR
ncbi:TIGR01777 family oxidoreductase [Kribbia dieselivorans]|uniref:TIGR01777 family oxidoreductase n=1 Tax=Kribbia dieselivorans TaxID=331526 RepID=UPI0008396BFC|nr:TIGR01777 family oxidoreductase [Kribbia dieselivorans]